MTKIPENVAAFLHCNPIAVVGVSRNPKDFSRAVYRRLAERGVRAFPVNPTTDTIGDERCYPDLTSLPEPAQGVMVLTPPEESAGVVKQCVASGASHVWLHRSFGVGSVSRDAVGECDRHGIECIVGGCPLMYCSPVDLGHRCMRWWLGRKGRVLP